MNPLKKNNRSRHDRQPSGNGSRTNWVVSVSQIEDDVCRKIKARADKGWHKYGKSMERLDLLPTDWLTHLQEELMDAIVYIEKLIDGTKPDEEEL